MNSLTLKWGSVKGWHVESAEARAALQKWADFGVSLSAMLQRDTPEQRDALLAAIDHMDEIWLDWEDKQVTREEAKAYILNYGKERGMADTGDRAVTLSLVHGRRVVVAGLTEEEREELRAHLEQSYPSEHVVLSGANPFFMWIEADTGEELRRHVEVVLQEIGFTVFSGDQKGA